MATKTMLSTAGANAAVLGVVGLLNSSGVVLKIFDGVQVAGPDTVPSSSQNLLCSLVMSTQPFSTTPVSGVATANPISTSGGAPILLTGTASWCRMSSSSQATSSGIGVVDGSAGTAAANCILNSVALSSGATLSISSLTITQPPSTS